jgi:hypothetical protein
VYVGGEVYGLKRKIMKTDKEILERIEHIKTLSNGYGINERRIKELEWVLKPSKLHQPTVSDEVCSTCRFNKSNTHHDKMWCRDCQQKNHYEQTEH